SANLVSVKSVSSDQVSVIRCASVPGGPNGTAAVPAADHPLVRVIGHVSRPGLKPWPVAIRWGLAVMFTVTGISHFAGMRDALIAMVPPWLPGAAALVTITGVLELLGAAGLLVRPTRI